MADLLECLLQLKGLAETPHRLEKLLAESAARRWAVRPAPGVWAPVEVAAHLADTELMYGARIRLVLTADRPRLASYDQVRLAERAGYLAWRPGTAVARFAARRADNVELLETCNAPELERVGIHAERGAVSIADIVATLLAHDIDHLGQIRQRLGLAEPEARRPLGDSR